MVDRINPYSYRTGSAGQRPIANENAVERQSQSTGAGSFAEILRQETAKQVGELKFSSHATSRLASRRIELSAAQMKSLNEAVSRAADKGCRESLVLMGNLAFVVSVKNKTVITVMDGEHMKENVFTNIDSAVITK